LLHPFKGSVAGILLRPFKGRLARICDGPRKRAPAVRSQRAFALSIFPMKLPLSFRIALTTIALGAGVSAADHALPRYRKLALNDQFLSEGAMFADLNKDGHADAVSGPYWWAGPDFKQRHEFYPALPFDPQKYSDNFFAFAHDFNGDGWLDVLILGFPGVDASWYENPGEKGGMWRRKVVFVPVDNESPTFGDLLGTGQPALVCTSGGRIGYATFDAKDASKAWIFHAISPPGPWQRYTHGLGFGDINGDGRNDILEKDGWWEQPASLTGDPIWKQHKYPFAAGRGGAQMYAYDINGDKLADVITSIDAHGYGLSWYEQTRAADGTISFRPHPITSTKAEEKIGGVQFSQLHAIALVDFDGDGLLDVVTGKRWWAHGPKGDADPLGTPVIYAFLLRRAADGTVTYVPQLIEDTTGVGTQLFVGDANSDGRPDLIIGNKRGTAVLLSEKAAAKK
jgi:hypothetical protein